MPKNNLICKQPASKMAITQAKVLKIFKIFIFLILTTKSSNGQTEIIKLQNCTTADLLKLQQKQQIKVLELEGCNITALSKNDLQGFENLANFSVIGSELTKMENNSLNTLKQLRVLTLKQNKIAKLETWLSQPLMALKVLDLSHNFLLVLPYGSLESYESLQILNLKANQLAVLNETAFQQLHYLKQLDLSQNNLKSIGNMDFAALEDLNHLDLNNNRLEEIATKSFDLNAKLNQLNLAHNQLKALNFLTNRNLKTLNLSNNLFEEIHASSFRESIELTTLDLSWNHIESLGVDAFSGLKSVEFLDLAHNRILNVSANSFMHLKSLKHLKLNHNYLTQLPLGIFDGMKLLETIHLSHNNLSSLSKNAFAALPFLIELKIAANLLVKIEFLQNFANGLQFSQLSIDLSQNKLKEAALNLSSLSKFKNVDISRNIWSCSWLIDAIIRGISAISLGYDYQVDKLTEIYHFSGIDCFDEQQNRSVLLLNSTTSMVESSKPTMQVQHTEATKSCQCNENSYRHLSPSPPTVVWPKLYMDKFDSRSVIIWMLIAIAVAFAALRIGRQFLEKKDRKRRLLRKFMPQQSQTSEMQVLRLDENNSPRDSTAKPYQQHATVMNSNINPR